MAELTRDELFVGGVWRAPATSTRLVVINPATEDVVGSCPEAAPGDVDAAVAAAQAHFASGALPRMSITERCEVVERLLEGVLARVEEAARLVTAEMGVPVTQSLGFHKMATERIVGGA